MGLLDITDLTVEFPTRRRLFTAVDALNLKVNPGEIHGLVGESGAGKSTVGAAVMGLLDPPGRIAKGNIVFKNQLVDTSDGAVMHALRGRRISMIFQDPLTSLNPLLTIGDQLTETIRANLQVSASDADGRARELLDRVGIPDPDSRLNQYPHQFSGGMRQRVVIALALCSEPDVIIADEPTTALDVAIQAQILDLIRDVVDERKVGVILITHDMGVIANTTDRVTVMYRGKVVETGPTAKILSAPEHAYTQSLIAAVPRPHKKVHRFPRINYDGDDPDFAIEDLARDWPRYDNAPGKPLLSVRDLTKRFIEKRSLLPWGNRYFTAVDQLSFDIMPGEVLGLVGESGSGKSTVARMIAGLYKVDGGRVTFDGDLVSDLSNRKVQRAYRQEIQMIFQDPFSSLNPRMRVDQIVAEPLRHHRLLSGQDIPDRVGELLEQVGLGADARLKYPHEFSGGQRQRIAIARALATQPRFLICDEPTSALDVSIQAQILNILKDLQDHLGLTILFISHALPVVRQMCDRVAVMRRGQIVELADSEQLFTAPKHDYTKELLRLTPRTENMFEKPEA
ncbi:ABC transporter ATP-binding protein [Rhodobacteraceae bacterium]|nr:ABC transporter ATP-binding protein [Paracoccaceae bacterium]